ncbi:hypothetical protein MBM_09502 [Drepanopeziza brunnea f. sp. 'multigermtubi' MB_m1]|uniref:Uncharacterized protein n=1 Tax=Marssonina brunnea f. sp. multigermtubi (strain MB_m1) TaxID=1072389 RepID=K1WJD6_MARBU|nr:uncharacterized protein MBM_09502 [Drepanopeziza brunnea f. sp. 'multigermtubi' MB_m1]EKD12327.1 hypothetical protein MBM_09502 [Drepanopeziza brunnea f. sp. 'multigermtubi' MB_m1]
MALEILTIADEEGTKEIGKEIEATSKEIEATGFGNGLPRDLGSGNELLKDLGKVRPITGNYIGNLLPIRLLAKHGTLAYGTLGALDDNGDDFFKLRAADLYLRAKELALFARSFLKELNECFKKLAKELKGIQGSLRLGLKDDRSLANKLYSACKNVLKTTIARMNLAFTFTAAVANIRRAIAFATKTSRPAKASKAYASFNELHDHTCFYNTLKANSDLDEEYECFIQDR